MVYILLANGFEEVEAFAPLDVLRRLNIDVKTAGVGGTEICGAHGIKVTCDVAAEGIALSDVGGVILPGGMPGTKNLQADTKVNEITDYCFEKGLLVSAICAAPMILGQKGILKGCEATCFPGFEQYLEGAEVTGKSVAVNGNIITGKGAGAALEFGAAIADFLLGKCGAGKEILKQMQYPL